MKLCGKKQKLGIFLESESGKSYKMIILQETSRLEEQKQFFTVYLSPFFPLKKQTYFSKFNFLFWLIFPVVHL